jgi:hypothetical protein
LTYVNEVMGSRLELLLSGTVVTICLSLAERDSATGVLTSVTNRQFNVPVRNRFGQSRSATKRRVLRSVRRMDPHVKQGNRVN